MDPRFVQCGDGAGPVVVITRFDTMDDALVFFGRMQPADGAMLLPVPVPPPVPLPRAVCERRGLPLTREAALKPPLTGGPASNARVETLWSDDEDMDILDAGGRGEHALDAVAFRLHRGVGEVRRRYRQLTEGVRRELEG